MTEPAAHRPTEGESLEESVADILAAARPLPPLDEMVIDDLTEEEDRVFLETIFNA